MTITPIEEPALAPPWLVALVDKAGAAGAEVISPIQIVGQDGILVDWSWESLIPGQGSARERAFTTPGNYGAGAPTWTETWDWIHEAFAPDPSTPAAELNLPNVIKAFQAPLERIVQTLATNVNVLGDFMHDTFERDQLLQQQTVAGLEQAWVTLATDANTKGAHIDYLERYVVPSLQAQISQEKAHNDYVDTYVVPALQAQISALVDRATFTEQFVIPNLQAQITALAQRDPLPAAHADTAMQLLPIAAGLAALAGTVKTLTDFKDECAQPMCDNMGPNSDLGKFMKLLNMAALAALLAELAALDRGGVENLLRGFQSIAGGIIGTFDDLFVGGGASLGETLAGAAGSVL